MRLGLTGRMLIAGGVLLVVVAASFVALIFAVLEMGDSASLARHSRVELEQASRLEKLLIDMETGLRGFVITRDRRFLEPWQVGSRQFPRQAAALARFADSESQRARLNRIREAGRSYIADYGEPLIRAVQRDDPAASSVAVSLRGKRVVDALRAQFTTYSSFERALLSERQDAADADATRAIIAAFVALAVCVLLIAGFSTYLAHTIVRPVTRAATMASRVAAGALETRMPDTGVAEIGDLAHSLNAMVDSLEGSQAAERRLLEQQSALRRVATLVAVGGPPEDVFAAVAREVGEALPADGTYLTRYESDETLYRLAAWLRDGEVDEGPERVPVRGYELFERILVSGKAGRTEGFAGAPPEVDDHMRRRGFHSGVGCPIFVGGRVWGMLGAAIAGDATLPEDAEIWLTDFTELAATAISNAEARSELAASRARIVAASDEARRHIERNLHDGAQQWLVSLALELRAAESSFRSPQSEPRPDLGRIADELDGVIDELREIARGIHPAILSEEGLAPALRTLARRSAVPVELDLRIADRFPEPIEVAAYYTVAEALANAAKHAQAKGAHVVVDSPDGRLRVVVRDDGAGGADPAQGSGLVGLRDRVEALGGRLEVASPRGRGTSLVVELPLATGGSQPPL